MIVVHKYGGSSLADRERIFRAAKRVAEGHRAGNKMVVVVSAQGDTTDLLLQKLAPFAPNEREKDAFLAVGEQMSACLMATALRQLGVEAVSLAGWQMGLLTDGNHGDARVLGLGTDRIQRELAKGRVVVATGFQGVTQDGELTTLGRGGSDTTAVALAAFLKAEVCQIYTDVDGVYDRDPRAFPDAKRFDRIGYDQMLHMARNGAQVLHDRCVELAKEKGVAILVLSSFRPGPGTLVEG